MLRLFLLFGECAECTTYLLVFSGAIEIINPVPLIKEGDRVTASATSLLSKLNIKPFFYGARVPLVYEAGSVYDAKVLDFSQVCAKVACCAAVSHTLLTDRMTS